MADKIAVIGRIPDAGLTLLNNHGDVHVWDGEPPVDAGVRDLLLRDADAAITQLTQPVDAAFLDAAPMLRVVANVAVGYDNIDLEACRARNIRVTNTPGVLTDATADIAMSLILMSTRRLGEGERLVRSGAAWRWGMFLLLGTSLQNKTLGIVGMGEIGRAVATRARAFGMRVVYHNRRQVAPEVEASLDARFVPLDELLATADVVSLNCPYTTDTHHLLDADARGSMKPSAFVVNTARGAVIDEAALVDALAAGRLAGAGLDVYEHEPEVHPGLVDRDDVVLLPHLGSATVETRSAMSVMAASDVLAVLAGHEPDHPVV